MTMPIYSQKSMDKLKTAHNDLLLVFLEVIKGFDNTIVYGYRSPELQFSLFKKGRALINGVWQIVDESKRVTNCDGYNKKSNHNYTPSKAIDAIPYPISWDDEARMRFFAGYVLGIANQLKINIRWGGDWDADTDLNDQTFNDLAHFEIIEP